jgi:pimeloyl-ACP methyl ester carboxylesterase
MCVAKPSKRLMGVVGVAAGLGAAGVGAAVGIRKIAVGRVRFQPDPDVNEPFGELRGRALTVLADDGVPLHVEIDEPEPVPGQQSGTGGLDPSLTVVFCHGYTLNQDSWHYQRRDLAGTRMVFWDQRSHGRSGRSKPARATIDQTGEDLYAVLRATVRPGDPVLLVGHSMGGMSIMALADRHPELFGDQIVGVALINTSHGGLSELTLGLPLVLAKMVRPLAPGVVRGLGRQAGLVDRTRQAGADIAFMVIRRMGFADKYVSPTVVDFVEEMIRATPIDVIAEFYPALMAHDKLTSLAVIGRVPVLVLAGGQDRVTSAALGRAVAETIGDAELTEVADAGHLLPLEYPGIVTAALHRLIAQVRPPQVEERSA